MHYLTESSTSSSWILNINFKCEINVNIKMGSPALMLKLIIALMTASVS